MTPCRYAHKVPYRDEAEALAQVKHAKKTCKGQNKKLLNKLHAYLCPDAAHWHIGHDRFKRGKLHAPTSIATA